MQPLSEQEMVETEGKVWPWLIATGVRAGYGAVGGFSTYWGGYSATGQWGSYKLLSAVGGGAVGGVLGWNPITAATIGAGTGGFASSYDW